MPILAMDTATMVSGVAVADNKKLLAEIIVENKLTHSETLLPNVEKVMAMAGVTRGDLEAVAVSIGPGSFTGLRIGLAAAKAIAYGLNIPLVGIPTMEGMAWHYPMPGITVAGFVDAQKGNVYTAHYKWNGIAFDETRKIEVVSLEQAINLCGEINTPVVAVGDMAEKKLTKMDDLPDNLIIPPQHMLMPRAANIAMAGLKKLADGVKESVMDMEPIYIRKSEAEVLWEKRHNKPEQVENK
ncbi:MAG: tRNA (adenosine(37)-N6)-threonylcarbamoyltransferase complex dimerization subunit type 1 TsaB [Anaerovibrio sp.]|uniref:tRNA (adenosine(37)-N6)-threonylcarbamoyltransferase complex dimerization subunit type 1 TsaB n=1 Tax=Anaerovibrio sp. TaxID=1872532 RepID=UPI0025D15CB6|nr:tRNA (adenosine(37)-N6)-threonylcarbamoyltransferase complex dimerization subunit type 1 TsaB [Anaerovibrio sp.]MCR5176691.1 tRNA (adenosine(37)-N6)-threonylcarbamoyltransferase complex dimerization subunit type 1 TsaB [Anaerovibrio sp.]